MDTLTTGHEVEDSIKYSIKAAKNHFNLPDNQFDLKQVSKNYSTLNPGIRHALEGHAIQTAIKYLQDQDAINPGYYTVVKSPNKSERKQKTKSASPLTISPKLGETAIKWYDCIPRGNMLINKYFARKECAEEFALSFLNDALTCQDSLEDKNFKIFLNDFIKYLNKYKKFISVERKILSAQHEFHSKNPCSFFANLRLSNRSQTRLIKQFQDEATEGWQQFLGETVQRAWKFNIEYEALENQEITANQQEKTFSRRDRVINLKKYENIHQKINSVMNGKITDMQIACWIRQTLQGKDITAEIAALALNVWHKKKLLKIIANLTYLLFGCEGVRNPASLIINQMMLDLIIKHGFLWEQMLDASTDDGFLLLMPMAIENAVEGARALQKFCLENMPFPYYYPGNTNENKNNLFNKEMDFVKNWFSYEKDNFNPNYQELKQAIQDSFEGWYGFTYNELTKKIPIPSP